jgi:hypothetical protein
VFPHEYLEAYVLDILGRRVQLLGSMKETVVMPIATGLSNQLAAYLDCRPSAALSIGDVTLREGANRTYLFAAIRSHGALLRLRSTLMGWQQPEDTNDVNAFVQMHVARRWRFIERHRRLLERLFARIGDALVTYYARKPNAVLGSQHAMHRILEGVDSTYLAIELDERTEVKTSDQPNRYNVN